MASGSRNMETRDPQHVAAVREELARVLASDAFRGAPQLSGFLAFIVERTLEGRSAELKGYTVAVEAFGRSPDFDPQIDPIVRVEAGRLRKALTQYYMTEGAGASVRITMPVGGYVPVFERDSSVPAGADLVEADSEGAPEAGLEPDLGASRRWIAVVVSALLLGLLALVFWHGRGRDQSSAPPAVSERAVASANSSVSQTAHLPVLAISVLDLPQDPVSVEIARRFSSLLVDALARFDDVVTVKAPGDARSAEEGADYILELSAARFGDMTESSARLRAVKDDRIVWTTSNTRPPARDPNDPEWPEMARRLAIRLAEPFGVLHADFRQLATSEAMRCIFLAFDYRRTLKPDDHLEARACLEGVLQRDPAFPPAWSQLAFLILDEYTAGVNPASPLPLDRALAAALNAVRLAPSSARAQQAMMAVLFARGQTDEALTAGREAMARNPFDPDIMAGLGARLVQLNRPVEALPLLQRAMALSNGRPPAYDFFAFLAARFTGANKLAEGYAANLLADEGAFSWLGRALQSAAEDDNVGLASAIAKLEEAAPLFALDPRLFLERRGFAPAVATRIISDLGPTLGDLLKRP